MLNFALHRYTLTEAPQTLPRWRKRYGSNEISLHLLGLALWVLREASWFSALSSMPGTCKLLPSQHQEL